MLIPPPLRLQYAHGCSSAIQRSRGRVLRPKEEAINFICITNLDTGSPSNQQKQRPIQVMNTVACV